MNFNRLIEEGTYKKSDLSSEGQKFVSGMELALDEVDSFISNRIEGFEDSDSNTLGKIKREIATAAMDGFKLWLQSKINETIVIISDTETALEEGNNGEKD